MQDHTQLLVAFAAGSVSAALAIYVAYKLSCKGVRLRRPPIARNALDLIGATPLIYLASLSEETGCEIYGKAEFLNPGGSVKDRVALAIAREGAASGQLLPGGLITEGTAGSTGVSLAMVSCLLGYRCFVALPDDAAMEKATQLRALGAEVLRVRPVAITHPGHFVNVAQQKARAEGGMFADQFENLANMRAHLTTGEEIWAALRGRVDGLAAGAGTGGTLAGCSQALKARNPRVTVALVDPPGSSLYNKVTRGVLWTSEEAEGRRLRHPQDTITEGLGINRSTANFGHALIDNAFKCSDREAVEMGFYLLRNEGLFVGSSAAVNCVGAVKLARELGPGHVVVTLLCDGGLRHVSKFYSLEYL